MAALPAKTALMEELLRKLRADLETIMTAQRAAQEAATHPDAKPENDKDTRAVEQSYLARGQATRVEELTLAVDEVSRMTLRDFGEEDPIAIGALILATEGRAELILFLAPHGGGMRLAKGSTQVITPVSPLGRAMLGKCAGDDCELVVAGSTRSLVIDAVH